MALQTTETGDAGKAEARTATDDNAAASFTKLIKRILIANAVAAPVGASVALVIGSRFNYETALTGFLTGYLVGLMNMLLLASSAKRGIEAGAGRAGRIVTVGYYARFALTVIILAGLVLIIKIDLLPLMAGFTVAVATTIVSVFLSFKEES